MGPSIAQAWASCTVNKSKLSVYQREYAATLSADYRREEHVFTKAGVTDAWPLGPGVAGRFPDPKQVRVYNYLNPRNYEGARPALDCTTVGLHAECGSAEADLSVRVFTCLISNVVM